jgi:hypothetical protein
VPQIILKETVPSFTFVSQQRPKYWNIRCHYSSRNTSGLPIPYRLAEGNHNFPIQVQRSLSYYHHMLSVLSLLFAVFDISSATSLMTRVLYLLIPKSLFFYSLKFLSEVQVTLENMTLQSTHCQTGWFSRHYIPWQYRVCVTKQDTNTICWANHL